MRLFFAVDLPAELKQMLGQLPERYGHLALRWTKPENLHLTLLFVGWREPNDLPRLIATAEGAGARHRPFTITLGNLVFGPPDRPARMMRQRQAVALKKPTYEAERSTLVEEEAERPTTERKRLMIWLTGSTPPEFTNLARDLSEATQVPLDYSPALHLTLARSRETIRAPQGQQLETLSLPPVEVKAFQLMESKLERKGPQYTVLKNFVLRTPSG